jgi:hypothetical protein
VSTNEIALFAIVGLCWTGLVVRLWDLSRKSGNRALRWICLGMIAMALSTTLQITSLIALVDAHSTMDTAGTVSNCLTLLALTGFRCGFHHMISPDTVAAERIRSRLRECAVVVVAIVVLFLLFGSNYSEVIATRDHVEQAPVISAAGYLYLAYLCVSVVGLTSSSWAYARISTRFSLRVGMSLMGIGLLVGLAYGVVRLASMATYQLGLHILVLHGNLIGYLFRSAIVIDLVGILLPYVGSRVGLDRLVDRLRIRRSLRALHPLWHALRTAFPSIVLENPDSTPEHLLHRGIIEIWDGRLQLRPWFDPEAAERARDRGAAAVEATLIADALRRKASGAPPAEPVRAPRPYDAGDDVAWLNKVSKAFREMTTTT